MDNNATKFLNALIKSTMDNDIEWNILQKKYYSSITNISSGIFNAYYTTFEDNKYVLYQYRSFNEDTETEHISYFLSIVDDAYNYIYEFGETDFPNSINNSIYKLYKLVERSASGVDKIINNFLSKHDK